MVIARGKQVSPSWPALQKDLVTLSSSGAQVIATDSGHYIQLEQPDIVVAAIEQVVTTTSRK